MQALFSVFLCIDVWTLRGLLLDLTFGAESLSHPIISRLSLALASGLAGIISTSLTRVLECSLEQDAEMSNCLFKWVK